MTTNGALHRIGRLAQNSVEAFPFIRDRDALTRRFEPWQRLVTALDNLAMRGFHLRHVVYEQKFSKVIAQCGARPVLAC